MNPITEKLPIRKAAKAVRRTVKTIRERYIDTGKVTAYRVGGKDDAPRLRVYLSELQAAIDNDSIYEPPAKSKQKERQARPKARKIHPAAMGMRRQTPKPTPPTPAAD